jgi:hypothetical protein
MSQKTIRFLALGALLVGIGKFFRFHAYKVADGPEGEYRREHWQRPHGPMFRRHKFYGHKPPWQRTWHKPFEQESQEAEPDAEANATQATI